MNIQIHYNKLKRSELQPYFKVIYRTKKPLPY